MEEANVKMSDRRFQRYILKKYGPARLARVRAEVKADRQARREFRKTHGGCAVVSVIALAAATAAWRRSVG